MKNIYAHSIRSLITLLCMMLLGVTSSAQNTSPVYVIEFNKIMNGIMDEGKLQKNEREGYDNNPVCEIKVKAQGFDEATLQKLIFVPRNIMMMHKAYENGEYRLYVSSKKPGSILIKYQGEYEFKLPYNLEPKKIYELILGMETATMNIISTPDDAAIYIDGEKKVGATPYQMKKIKRGQHVLELRMAGYESFADMVTIKAGEVNKQFENVTLEAVRVATGVCRRKRSGRNWKTDAHGRGRRRAERAATAWQVQMADRCSFRLPATSVAPRSAMRVPAATTGRVLSTRPVPTTRTTCTSIRAMSILSTTTIGTSVTRCGPSGSS